MIEKNTDRARGIISEDTDDATQEKDLEAKRRAALQELFLILESDAEKKGKPVNAAINAIPMIIRNGGESKAYMLRINPAIISNGKLNIAVLDLYRDEAFHVQQWVIKAEWEDGKPNIKDLDESMVEDGTIQFRLTEIAEFAGNVLSGKYENADNLNTTNNLIMQMPPGYSPRIN